MNISEVLSKVPTTAGSATHQRAAIPLQPAGVVQVRSTRFNSSVRCRAGGAHRTGVVGGVHRGADAVDAAAQVLVLLRILVQVPEGASNVGARGVCRGVMCLHACMHACALGTGKRTRAASGRPSFDNRREFDRIAAAPGPQNTSVFRGAVQWGNALDNIVAKRSALDGTCNASRHGGLNQKGTESYT